MDQTTDLLSALLADPQKLSAAAEAVSSILGPPAKDAGAPQTAPQLPAKQSDAAELIRALKPFLSPARREKADRALRLLTLVGLASQFQDIR